MAEVDRQQFPKSIPAKSLHEDFDDEVIDYGFDVVNTFQMVEILAGLKDPPGRPCVIVFFQDMKVRDVEVLNDKFNVRLDDALVNHADDIALVFRFPWNEYAETVCDYLERQGVHSHMRFG